MADEAVIIIGAGPAGLAAAAALERRGVSPLVIERGPSVATSWRGRHDHLRLNTHRTLSHQPGRRMPRGFGSFPSRDQYVGYLEECSRGLRVRLATDVDRIDPADGGWTVATSDGPLTARHAVVATGPDLEPVWPAWADRDRFSGTLLHAGQFRNVADVQGRDVLVIGAGNSGVDLLNHLVRSDVGQLWLSARSGMHIIPARMFGVPLHLVAVAGRYLPVALQDLNVRMVQRAAFGDLTRHGYPRATVGAITRIGIDNVTLAVDDGFVAALEAQRVAVRPEVDRLEGDTVHFVDGTTCRPHVIICATGYRPGLERLVGHFLPLDHLGMPPFVGTTASPDHPGLWFFGLNRSPYGNMHIRRREARRLARRIADGAAETRAGGGAAASEASPVTPERPRR